MLFKSKPTSQFTQCCWCKLIISLQLTHLASYNKKQGHKNQVIRYNNRDKILNKHCYFLHKRSMCYQLAIKNRNYNFYFQLVHKYFIFLPIRNSRSLWLNTFGLSICFTYLVNTSYGRGGKLLLCIPKHVQSCEYYIVLYCSDNIIM